MTFSLEMNKCQSLSVQDELLDSVKFYCCVILCRAFAYSKDEPRSSGTFRRFAHFNSTYKIAFWIITVNNELKAFRAFRENFLFFYFQEL